MIIMKSTLTVLLLLAVYSLHAQNHDFSEANSGYLITHSDSLKGAVSIDLESNTVLLKTQSGIYNHSAKQVDKVVFFDNNGMFKTYVSGYWGADHQSILFEELVGGTNPLLFREGVKFDQFDDEDFPPYFTRKGESIYSLGNKRDILNLFQNENEIAAFVKKNKLNVKIREDLILLFSLGNGTNPVINSSIASDEI